MFGRRFTLFKLLGFEVRLDASWLILAVLITWTLAVGVFPFYYPGLARGTYWWMGAAGSLLLFGSIVAHELCHSVVAKRYGIPMRGITLFVFGGVAEMDEEPPTAKSEFLMAIAGPIASVILGFLFYAIVHSIRGRAPVELVGVLAYLARINWILAAFNMIPAFPLDGGRVLRSILWNYTGDLRRATQTAAKISNGFAIALIVYAALQLLFGAVASAIWWFLIGMFLRSVAKASYEQVLVNSALHGEPVSRFMNTDLRTVPPGISIEELVKGHMYRYHHRMFPVLEDSERLKGCVSAEQVKTVPREQWQTHTVAEIVKPCTPENTITPETDSADALRLMQRSHTNRLMVVEDGRLVAIVSLKDLMDFLAMKLDLHEPPALRAA
ncbi:MAG: site-2 protease family protein [Bryobacterales bacterium]|nr:site-2 protease family protein [Bryobacterales bacterium]MBV9399403.1 site-2 protease family protein [Bryobacterales bacterium]